MHQYWRRYAVLYAASCSNTHAVILSFMLPSYANWRDQSSQDIDSEQHISHAAFQHHRSACMANKFPFRGVFLTQWSLRIYSWAPNQDKRNRKKSQVAHHIIAISDPPSRQLSPGTVFSEVERGSEHAIHGMKVYFGVSHVFLPFAAPPPLPPQWPSFISHLPCPSLRPPPHLFPPPPFPALLPPRHFSSMEAIHHHIKYQ